MLSFYKSTIGKKVVVAVTGCFLFLFVIGHMAGNMKVFLGYDRHGVHHIDAYGHFLRTFLEDAFGYGGFLWLMRGGLLAILALHLYTVMQLQVLKAKARPVDYKKQDLRASTFSARTMMLGGFVILLFIVFHLLHLTLGTVLEGFVHGEVYANLHRAFRSPLTVFMYIIAMAALGLHLRHGLWSFLQTLGLDNPDRNKCIRLGAAGLSVVIVLGFLSVPLAIYFGILIPPANL